jgi:hypothetical protein
MVRRSLLSDFAISIKSYDPFVNCVSKVGRNMDEKQAAECPFPVPADTHQVVQNQTQPRGFDDVL